MRRQPRHGPAGTAGRRGDSRCSAPAASLGALRSVEDLEGSSSPDTFYGDGGPNQLLGHEGADTYRSGRGRRPILANAADEDPVIDCGADTDTAIVDRQPQFVDAPPIDCEATREADPYVFQAPTEPPAEPPVEPPAEPAPLPPVDGGPTLPVPPPAPSAQADVTAPRTLLTARPAALTIATKARRRVVFGFGSSERGASFRCKLDRQPYRTCVSPRAYSLSPGKHVLRIFAIDVAGNADPTPALIRFGVRRR